MRRLLVFTLLAAASLLGADADRDGLDDEMEQALLLRFLPSFVISGGECDVAPAEFMPGVRNPTVVARNGTIYGQVFPHDAERVEVHYYHLWNRDCGPVSHSLDAEHVSALVSVSNHEPKAEFWYAAAHEDTLCDSGGAASAKFLAAEQQGPPVWVSRAKHGSFLAAAVCRRGCGGDRCETVQTLKVHQIINIGEPGAPLNGAVWVNSGRWPLLAKMYSDFDAPLIARLQASDGLVELRGVLMPAQVAIAGGGRAVTEVGGAEKRTEGAVSTAHGHVEKALSGSKKSVKNWLRKRF